MLLSPASLARLSGLQRLLIWVLGAVVAVVVGYAVFYRPARAELTLAENEFHAAGAALASAQLEVEEHARWAAGFEREEEVVRDALARTPGADGTAEDLLFSLPGLAAASGLTIDRWQPLPEERAGEHCVRRPVQVHARGSHAALAELLRRVTELPAIVAVDELAIARPEAAESDDGALEISFRASVVRLDGPSARTATVDPNPSARL